MEFKFEVVDLVLLSPAIAIFLTSLIPLFLKVMRGNQEPNSFVTTGYGILGLVGAAVGILLAQGGITKTAFESALVFDSIGMFTNLVVLFCAGVALLMARENFATANKQFSEFVFLLLSSVLGMLIVSWANDLIILFVGIELMSLALYILIALSTEQRLSKEAAFKYFVLGSFASAVMLYGIAFIYGTAGSTYLPEITSSAANLIESNRMFLFGAVFLILGLCFKVSIFPFHAWTPDVYHGAPTPVTGLMATGVKAVCLAFLLRLMGTEALIADRAQPFVAALQWLAALTILGGNIAAVIQNNLKRMLAYSSIAHSGYVMMGLLAAGVGGENAFLGGASVVFYIFAYSLMTIGAFAVISIYEKRAETELVADDLNGIASKHPWMAFSLSVFLLSMGGIPPTIGFFGKLFIFSAAIKQGFVWLVVWGVIGSVISVYYYLRPVVNMYMRQSIDEEFVVGRYATKTAALVVASLVLITGVFSEPVYQYVLVAVKGIFQ